MKKELLYKFLIFSVVFSFPFTEKLAGIDVGFVNVYLFRLLLIVSMVVLIMNRNVLLPLAGKMKVLFLFQAYLLCFAVISLFWVYDRFSAIQHVSYIMWGILTVVVLNSLLRNTNNGLHVVFKAWITSYVTLMIFALFEIATISHFYGSFIAQLEGYDAFRKLFKAPLATFTNPNDYAAYVMLSLSVFVMFIRRKNSVVYLLIFLISIIIIYYSRSNLAMFSLRFILLQFFLYVLYSIFIVRLQPFGIGLSVIRKPVFHSKGLSLIIFVFVLTSVTFTVFFNRTVIYDHNRSNDVFFVELPKNSQGLSLVSDKFHVNSTLQSDELKAKAFESESFSIRRHLIMNGLCLAGHSYLLGAGAGQFIEMHERGKVCYELNIYTNPHNFVIEIFSQYGIIPVLVLIWLLLVIYMKAWKAFLCTYKTGVKSEVFGVLTLIPVYVLMSNAPSSFISLSLNWMVLTVLVYISDHLIVSTKE
jgi:teichuronic acid biosynthesis protein TuaE